MHAWEQVQQTIEYIEDHISEEVNIENLAKMASLSPFYFQRLFSHLVRKPVAEYIKLRRMAKATESLLERDKRILDIALELGFTSHEHFSRTFKTTFGMTPEDYRKSPRALNRMTKPELLLHYTLIDEGVPLITDGIILEINRQVITESTYYTGIKKEYPVQLINGLGIESGEDPLDSLWRLFHNEKETILGFGAADNEEIGVTSQGSEEGYFSYFAGASSSQREVPEGYMSWEMIPGEYLVCSFEAENFEALVMDALYKAQQYIYNTWLPNHKLLTEPFCIERYKSHSPNTTSMEIWLKLIK